LNKPESLKFYDQEVAELAAENHSLAEALALGAGSLGILFAVLDLSLSLSRSSESAEQFHGVYRFSWQQMVF